MLHPFRASWFLLAFAVAVSLGGARTAAAQQGSFDIVETQTALKAALAELKDLRAQLATEKEAGQAMAAKLGAVTAEAAVLRDELAQLKTRAEAVGAGVDPRGLERKLLDALNDLRILKTENESLDSRLKTVAEAASAYLHAFDEQRVELRPALEKALALASSTVTEAAGGAAVRIESSQVVSVKPEQRLIVVNAGQRSGLKVGTPLRVYRNDRPTASAVVVDVRPTIAGSLVTEVEGDEFPKVGDTLRIDTRPKR
jgi:hypothetical protein